MTRGQNAGSQNQIVEPPQESAQEEILQNLLKIQEQTESLLRKIVEQSANDE